MGRAPHTVAIYLIIYQNYGIDEAIQLIKDKRKIAVLNKGQGSEICELFNLI